MKKIFTFIKNNIYKLLLLLLIEITFFILIFIIPQVREIFNDFGVVLLPKPIRIIFFLSRIWFIVLLSIIAIYCYIVIGKNTKIVKLLNIFLLIVIILLTIGMFMVMLMPAIGMSVYK
ncbi:MAG: hypothetical protein PHE88_02160 [Elusimicrobia bacterium]|nr:hypothetical protein [Elusimicrobiota bacterium]